MFKLGRESLGMRERNGEAGIPRGFDTPPAATALASTTISPYAAGMTLKGPDPRSFAPPPAKLARFKPIRGHPLPGISPGISF